MGDRTPDLSRPANDEMIAGYRDGLDLDCPEPRENRSRSYRHGFERGRSDKLPKTAWEPIEAVIARADAAMAADDADALPSPTLSKETSRHG